MVGIVLGLGFQWWPDLREPWQYIAFIFIYLDLIDYWIDYSPAIRKFPPRRELDLILHVIIMFLMFLLVYSTRGAVTYLFLTFMIYRVADMCWLYNIDREYKPVAGDKLYVETWLRFDFLEVVGSGVLFVLCYLTPSFSPLLAICIFIVVRLVTRILASVVYRRVFFA